MILMGYVGIETQRARNNRNSFILLAIFPLILFGVLYVGCFFWGSTDLFFSLFHWVALGVFVWYVIAYFFNDRIIDWATGAKPLQRMGNKRVYNLVENLCISCGMTMPKILIIEDSALNAFASGINTGSYAVTLTRGLIDNLDDKELEGVIAHELTHIRENDVRLSIIATVFVGIFAYPVKILSGGGFFLFLRLMLQRGAWRLFIWFFFFIPVFIVGFGLSKLVNFAISRNREYIADAGAAKLTKEPKALASALRKISGKSVLFGGRANLVSHLLIEHNSFDTDFLKEHYPPPTPMVARIQEMFETHPPIEHRIWLLERF